MDEPGYLLANLGMSKPRNGEAGSVTLQAESAGFQMSFGEESKTGAPAGQLTLKMIEDRQVKNKVCCSILPMPGFNTETFPFLVSRSRHCINLINVKTGTLQPLIKDVSSTAWYQESLLVLKS